MAEKRSMFDLIFGWIRPKQRQLTQLQLLSGYTPAFSPWGDIPYQSDIVRAAVDAIARNAAKLVPKHIRRVADGSIVPVHDQIERLLQVRPNPKMSAYDFFYKLITMREIDNNAFAVLAWDGDRLEAVWPVHCTQAQLLEDRAGKIYIQFWFGSGRSVELPYSEVIHLRRHFYRNDMLGENNQPINPTLDAASTINQGLAQAVKTSASLRGIIKYQGILKEDDIKKNRERFVNEYLSIQNTGGVAALDAKADYMELKNQPAIINAPQMKELRDAIYRYFGVNEKIVSGNYNEDEWAAFYEGTLEPIAVQMSQEFTAKLFSTREMGHGNEIVFESNRLQYASIRSKVSMVDRLVPAGLLTINEAREIFNLAPVEGGYVRLVSLNYVQADKQNLYQIGEEADEIDAKSGTGKRYGSEPDSTGMPPEKQKKPNEQKIELREKAVAKTPNKDLALDLFSGAGTLKRFYRKRFDKVISIEKDTSFKGIDYYMTVSEFIQKHLEQYADFDLADFDDEGCPGIELQKFFERLKELKRSRSFTLVITDGMALNLKRRDTGGQTDLDKYWLIGRKSKDGDYEEYDKIHRDGVKRIARKFGFHATEINLIRYSRGDVVASAWRITKD